MKEKAKAHIRSHKLEPLIVISGVTIYATAKGDYVCFVSDLDICNDGTGPTHGDPYHQSETAYYNGGKFLNADKDKYIVIPPQIRSMVPPVVMGCQARLTRLESMETTAAVTGDIGPDEKTGEAAYCLAKIINPQITHNTGDHKLIYFYELFPCGPAVVDGKEKRVGAAGWK